MNTFGPFVRSRSIVSIVVLVAAWCALWGSASFANVASGTILAAAVTVSAVGTPSRGTVRLVALSKLVGLVLMDLVKSTIEVAYEVITPADNTDESVIAVDLPEASRDHLLLLVVAITLTPGTAVVETDSDGARLYLHLLHDRSRAETIAHVAELARLAAEALPPRTEALSP